MGTAVLHAQNPVLIKDVNPGPQNSNSGRLSRLNDQFLFLGNDGVNGIELWKSDATEPGTEMVKNIGPGSQSLCQSNTGCGDEYLVVGDVMYFRASDANNGAELWRSDGTEIGTYMVKDINPGLNNCSNSQLMDAQYFCSLDNVLYFAADGISTGIEMWRSDGAESGTYLFKDFAVGANSIHQFMSNVNGFLYFKARNADGESELWISDGTIGGTILLKQMWVRGWPYNGEYFKEFNGFVYFAGSENDPNQIELWRTNGTPEGTELFADLNEFDGSDPHALEIFNDKLLFTADADQGVTLFTSDGTVQGTQPLLDANGNEFEADFNGSLRSADKFYFQGNNAQDQSGLWVSDGTNGGTLFLSDILSGSFYAESAVAMGEGMILYQ